MPPYNSTASIHAFADRIIVSPIEPDDVSVGGILIPENAQGKPQRGRVLSVGEGRRTETGSLIPLGISENDEVVYPKYAGNEIKFEGNTLLILKEADVMAVVRYTPWDVTLRMHGIEPEPLLYGKAPSPS